MATVSSRYRRLWLFAPPCFQTLFERMRHARAHFFRSAPVQPTRKNSDNTEQVLHQFFSWGLHFGRFDNLDADLSPTEHLFKIAIPKAHETIRILDQNQIDF